MMNKLINGVKLYDLDALHEMLGLSKVSMRSYIKRGLIKARKIGIKWYITEKNLNEFINQNQISNELQEINEDRIVAEQENIDLEQNIGVITHPLEQINQSNQQNNNSSGKENITKTLTGNIVEYTMEYWLDIDYNLTYISPLCEEITGYTPAEFLKDKNLIKEIVFQADRQALSDYMVDFSPEKPKQMKYRIITKNGELRWLELQQKSIIGRNGKFLGTLALNTDITEKLIFSGTKTFLNPSHELIFNELDIIVIILDSEYRIKAFNGLANLYSLLCFNTELSVGRKMNAIDPIDKNIEDLKIFERTLNGERIRVERKYKLYNEMSKKFLIHCLPIPTRESGKTDIYLIIEDIDKQIQRLKTLISPEQNLFEQYDDASLMVVATDKDKNIIYLNKALTEHTGYTKSEGIGRSILEFVVESKDYKLTDEWKKLWDAGVKFDFPINILCKDGHVMRVNIISIVERHSTYEPIVISYIKLISNEK